MKWTGRGVLNLNGKDIYPGQDIPNGLTEERIKKLKKSGDIDGQMSVEAYAKAQEIVEENIRKKNSPDEKNDSKDVVGALLKESYNLKEDLKELKQNDPKVSGIRKRLKEIEFEIKKAKK